MTDHRAGMPSSYDEDLAREPGDGEDVPEYGSCRCDGCRFEPSPAPLQNGLCPMCTEDGCPMPGSPAVPVGETHA